MTRQRSSTLAHFSGNPNEGSILLIRQACFTSSCSSGFTIRAISWTAVWVLLIGGLQTSKAALITPLIPLPNGDVAMSWPEAVSANGSVIVGGSTTNFPATSEAFRWEGGSLVGLGDLPGTSNQFQADPYSRAYDVNLDGSLVVGVSDASIGSVATLWHNGTMSGIGDLPGGAFDSVAYGVSQTGVVVGRGSSALGNEAFRWSSVGMTGLGDLPGGAFDSTARDISADGSVIVGTGTSAEGTEAFIYENGVMTGIGDLPGGDFYSTALSISADGSTAVGYSSSAASAAWIGDEAFIYQDGVMTGLGSLDTGGHPDLMFGSEALGVNGDGSVVVGTITDFIGGTAFIWDDLHGMRTLSDALTTDFGLDLTGWELNAAIGISADGRTIIGYGFNPAYGDFTMGFVVSVPEPASYSLLATGVLFVMRRRGS